jgi:hypothetical protein
VLTFVRWQKGQSRRGHVFAERVPSHPAATLACPYCGRELGTMAIQAIVVGMIDPDADKLAKFEAGGVVSAGAVLLHERCANRMDDRQLEVFVRDVPVYEGGG